MNSPTVPIRFGNRRTPVSCDTLHISTLSFRLYLHLFPIKVLSRNITLPAFSLSI